MARRRLSVEQRRDMWARWRRGETLAEIGQALGRATSTVHASILVHGGISPRDRKQRLSSLTAAEREEISRGLIAGHSVRMISTSLGRAASTVSREVARNGGRQRYRAIEADTRAQRAALRPKLCLLARDKALRNVVADKLQQSWSPQQISGWLAAQGKTGETMRVSHETIYRSLFIQARGVLKRELIGALRSGRRIRRAHGAASKGLKRSLIPDAVSIRQRPAEADDRAVPGHWEGDLLAGDRHSQIATLVERRSRFVMLVRIGAKTSENAVAALANHIKTLPRQAMASLTWDRGSELTEHAKFTLATNVKVYFCDPHSPWQRGSNENTNGLLRQYFPKGSSLQRITQAELDAVARELNSRPRQTLGFKTPAQVFSETLR